MSPDLEFEHDLIERSLEHVCNIWPLNPFGDPSSLVGPHDGVELVSVEAQCVRQIFDGVLVGAMKVHRLDFQDAVFPDVECPISLNDFNKRRVERDFRRAGGRGERNFSTELCLKKDERSSSRTQRSED